MYSLLLFLNFNQVDGSVLNPTNYFDGLAAGIRLSYYWIDSFIYLDI